MLQWNTTIHKHKLSEILGLPDLNLGPMTWILKLDLPKYWKEVCSKWFLAQLFKFWLNAHTYTNTDRHNWKYCLSAYVHGKYVQSKTSELYISEKTPYGRYYWSVSTENERVKRSYTKTAMLLILVYMKNITQFLKEIHFLKAVFVRAYSAGYDLHVKIRYLSRGIKYLYKKARPAFNIFTKGGFAKRDTSRHRQEENNFLKHNWPHTSFKL